MSEDVVEKASAVVLIAVVAAVFLGLLRLVLEHWTYSFLIVLLAVGVWYLRGSVVKAWKPKE
jgi:hypothetical protein